MKTSAELQQQSFIRKLVYFGIIVVLFTGMTFSGRFVAFLRGKEAPSSTWTVTGQARTLQLNESDQGEADLAGSTIRLALSGTRGFAITLFWLRTIEEQKKHNWNEVDFLVNTITKLQPHFLTPWLFQSWNLSYNVSVESDRVRDKYFYISRGIELLADGERINRGRGLEKDGTPYVLGNPDMRFWVGFYYQNKFGTSDEQHTLRSLLQMSCINPSKRDPNLLRRARGTVDRDAFLEFVRQNPLLCRRLRDSLRCYTPEAVIDFLEDNGKLPTRYEQVDGAWVLKRRSESQFPVVPDWEKSSEFAPAHGEWEGNFDSYHCAWAWHLFAQEPLPGVVPGKPSGGPIENYDKLRYRMPRQPAGIIFRQYPQRDQSYIAERLQKEGWFDDEGWEVDRWQQTSQWFPDERIIVGAEPRYSSKVAWARAYQTWKEHGALNGLDLSPQQHENLLHDARPYEEAFGFAPGTGGPERTLNELGEEMYRSYDAHWQIFNYQINLQMTNFRYFLFRAQTEFDDSAVQMRKHFYEAKRLKDAGSLEASIRKYDEAFAILTGDPSKNQQGLLEKYPNFRHDMLNQDELIEKEFAYLDLLESQRSPQMRAFMTAQWLVGAAAAPKAGAELFGATLFQFFPRPGELPSMFVGPLHGYDSKDQPWLHPSNLRAAEQRVGRVKGEVHPPANAPSGMGVAPK